MKYLITNPDSFGDIVLRQPLFKALLDAGHEVGLLVKQSYSQIVHFLDPRLRIFMMKDLNPYTIAILHDKSKVDAALDQAEEFDPDIVVIAPYQRTLIDIWAFERFAHKRTVGMKGLDVVYENGERIMLPTKHPGDIVLHVPEDLSEVEKNRRLLSLCLGEEVPHYAPRLALPPATLQLARETLNRLQLKPRSYIICTPGSTSLAVKQYPVERFINILEHWSQKYKREILLVSNEHEASVSNEIQAALKERNITAQTWVGNESTLEVLLGLISFSKAYFGNDTGPMHFAAAFEKPVIAVFGGGHWPRFLPSAEEGAIIVQELPCFGCGWQCLFHHALCIHGVKEEWVINAIDKFEANKLRPLTIFSNSFEGDVMNEWITEAKSQLTTYKGQITSANTALERHAAEVQASRGEVSALREQFTKASQDAVAKDALVQKLQRDLLQKDEERRSETAELRAQVEREKNNILAIEGKLAGETGQNATLRSQLLEHQKITADVQRQLVDERKRAKEIEQSFDQERNTTSSLNKQIGQEREAYAALRSRAEDQEKLAIAIRTQLSEEHEKRAAMIQRQLEDARQQNTMLTRQVQQKADVVRRAYASVMDLRPKLEELHLAIRQHDQTVQQLEGRLIGVAQSGWTKLGVIIGIPWLSRWHKMVFRQESWSGVPVVVKEEYENPLSVKDHLMQRINATASLLESMQ